MVSPMINLGIDLDGTLECLPPFYKLMLEGWKGHRVLLTARPVTERLITLDHLREWGVEHGVHYDELVMYPTPYLFYLHGKEPRFLKDISLVHQFANMAQREGVMLGVKHGHFGRAEHFDPEWIQNDMAEWKARVCVEKSVQVMFDDSNYNVKKLREAGVYVCHVDREYVGGK